MLKYFTPVERFPKPKNVDTTNDRQPPTDVPTEPCSSKKIFKKGAYLESDPVIRSQILEYHPNDQDEVRRAYLVKGPCIPKMTEYPLSTIGGRERCFQYSWHEEFDWLEYSKERDVVFCLPCYVCYKGTSNPAFVEDGFRGWNLKHKLHKHIGDLPNSYHKKCVKACENLMKVNRSIEYSYAKHSTKEEADYLIRLKASLEAVKFLVRGGLAFRGHDEGENSVYKDHFLEILDVFARISEETATTIANGGKNCRMIAPVIQKELANACAVETVKKIVEEIGDGFFSVLVDESGDCSSKEQMAVVVRFVDSRGLVVERFIGIAHVEDTSAVALKESLETLLLGFGLSLSKVRGQGYDGASNMRGKFGGLKTLIQNEHPQAYYVHCFSHQLQLCLMGMAKKHNDRPDMESPYVKGNKSKRLAQIVTTFHYFKNDCFLHVIDLVLQELNDRFSLENIELLSCVACLSPCYSFEAFDTKSLVRLARLYPSDFEDLWDKELSSELETYIVM